MIVEFQLKNSNLKLIAGDDIMYIFANLGFQLFSTPVSSGSGLFGWVGSYPKSGFHQNQTKKEKNKKKKGNENEDHVFFKE